jgi:hypothetical protein
MAIFVVNFFFILHHLGNGHSWHLFFLPCRFRRKRFNWPELDPFGYETDEEGQTCYLTLDNQRTDGLTPIRLFEIFEVFRV